MHYICEECTRAGSEWSRDALTAGDDWCPACERLTEPYHVDEMVEMQAQFDLGDEA
jgi:hypothetical protein